MTTPPAPRIAQRFALAAVLSIVAPPPVLADEGISVQAMVSHHQVPLDGQIELVIQAQGTQRVPAPALEVDGFRVQYVGPATRVSIVNRQVSSSIRHRYRLFPQQEGTFTLGPFRLEIEGTTLTTDPIEVVVGPASHPTARARGRSSTAPDIPPARLSPAPPAPALVPGGPGQPLQPDPLGSGIPRQPRRQPLQELPRASLGDAIQLELWVDQPKAYLNQPLSVRVQLLVGGIQVRGLSRPTLIADGFMVQPFGPATKSELVIGGALHTLIEFQTEVTPLRLGTLTVGPASMSFQVVQRYQPQQPHWASGSLFGRLFARPQRYPVTLEAAPVTVEVLRFNSVSRPTGRVLQSFRERDRIFMWLSSKMSVVMSPMALSAESSTQSA